MAAVADLGSANFSSGRTRCLRKRWTQLFTGRRRTTPTTSSRGLSSLLPSTRRADCARRVACPPVAPSHRRARPAAAAQRRQSPPSAVVRRCWRPLLLGQQPSASWRTICGHRSRRSCRRPSHPSGSTQGFDPSRFCPLLLMHRSPTACRCHFSSSRPSHPCRSMRSALRSRSARAPRCRLRFRNSARRQLSACGRL